MRVLHIQHRHVYSIHAYLAATQRLSDVLPTFSCRSTPFRISGPSQQRIDMACSATRPSLGQTARHFGLFLPAAVADALDGEKARRTAGDSVAHAADAGGQRHALVGDRSGGSAGTAKRVQNPSFVRRENLLVGSVVSSASRPQRRWSPPLEGAEQTAMRCKSALPRGRSECTHSHARGIVVNGAMTRPAPTHQEEATTSRLKGSGCGPRGSRRRTRTLTAHPFTHRREKPDPHRPHALGACAVLTPLPELPPHTAPAPSPLSGAEKDSTTAARIVTGSRRNEPVRSRRRQRVRRRLAAHHAGVASSVRLSMSSLLAWMSLG